MSDVVRGRRTHLTSFARMITASFFACDSRWNRSASIMLPVLHNELRLAARRSGCVEACRKDEKISTRCCVDARDHPGPFMADAMP